MQSAISRIINRLKDEGRLQQRHIANIVAVSPETMSRWSCGQAIPDVRTQTMIARLHFAVERLADLYTPEDVHVWLHAKHPMLNGERAVDFVNLGRTPEVLATIDMLDAAAYA